MPKVAQVDRLGAFVTRVSVTVVHREVVGGLAVAALRVGATGLIERARGLMGRASQAQPHKPPSTSPGRLAPHGWSPVQAPASVGIYTKQNRCQARSAQA